jgi:hypothetical protein
MYTYDYKKNLEYNQQYKEYSEDQLITWRGDSDRKGFSFNALVFTGDIISQFKISYKDGLSWQAILKHLPIIYIFPLSETQYVLIGSKYFYFCDYIGKDVLPPKDEPAKPAFPYGTFLITAVGDIEPNGEITKLEDSSEIGERIYISPEYILFHNKPIFCSFRYGFVNARYL